MKKKVICLLGPTACGKTQLAIQLVQKYPLEIISVDSAMVYRGMDIGTAKPKANELALAPHRLIDICDPSENYSAGQFCQDALNEINNIFSRGKIPLLVGGTMLYFHLLERGFANFPSTNFKVREKIDEEAKEKGWPFLHARLMQIDPKSAKHIHCNDSQRIQRALEIYYSTGKTLSHLQEEQEWQKHPFAIKNIILGSSDRSQVHERIEKRFDEMLKQGLIEEVEKLYHRSDLNPTLPSLRMVGYRQAWSYLAGEYDVEEMRLRAIYATRQFAKRQFTWLKQWEGVCFDCEDKGIEKKISAEFESEINNT